MPEFEIRAYAFVIFRPVPGIRNKQKYSALIATIHKIKTETYIFMQKAFGITFEPRERVIIVIPIRFSMPIMRYDLFAVEEFFPKLSECRFLDGYLCRCMN